MKQLFALLFSLALVACGGGSGSAGSGGTASGPSGTAITPPVASAVASNTMPVTVEQGPGNNVNIPYVSVKVCVPGTTTCKTIDKILVDTGSTGLRLLASAVTGFSLPPQTTQTSPIVLECAQFLHFVTWGPVKLADVVLGAKRAAAVPVQVVADPGYSIIPTSCGRAASAATEPSDLGANGILGVGLFVNDGQIYYNCAPSSRFTNCRVTLTPSQQVQNPVALFGSDNNGVVLQLPALTRQGAERVEGSLIFGIDTRDNNRLGAAKVIQTDSTGFFTTTYQGEALRQSFFDSGSNGLYFPDADLPTCVSAHPGFFCPPVSRSLSASISLINQGSDTVQFEIGNAATLLDSPAWAFDNLGGPMAGASFDWGLPFFFGRSVFTVIEGRTTSAGPGPLFAYTN
ncbi:MAG: DUF3443 domain-containing protein [Rhodoferax sp.]|nr:DUF3443 domain-containing protein [Rhodoferax sp.]MCF8212015.1 DUF3443 domain-containing protein [Rhodoferax sp.]